MAAVTALRSLDDILRGRVLRRVERNRRRPHYVLLRGECDHSVCGQIHARALGHEPLELECPAIWA